MCNYFCPITYIFSLFFINEFREKLERRQYCVGFGISWWRQVGGAGGEMGAGGDFWLPLLPLLPLPPLLIRAVLGAEAHRRSKLRRASKESGRRADH